MTRTIAIALLAYTGLLSGLFDAQEHSGQISVFIGVPTRHGFVDASPSLFHSVRDIEKQLAQRQGLVLVEDSAKADIRLWVVDRGIGTEAYGARATLLPYFKGAILYQRTTYRNTYWVATVLEVGSYRKEIVGEQTHGLRESFGAWTEAATKISMEVEAWVHTNRTRLVQLRRSEARVQHAPEAAYSKLTATAGIWRVTLPATAASLQLVDGTRLRIVLSGRYPFAGTLARNGNTFSGRADVAPNCAKEPPSMNLTDEAGGFTGHLELYDCASLTAGVSRVAFRLF